MELRLDGQHLPERTLEIILEQTRHFFIHSADLHFVDADHERHQLERQRTVFSASFDQPASRHPFELVA